MFYIFALDTVNFPCQRNSIHKGIQQMRFDLTAVSQHIPASVRSEFQNAFVGSVSDMLQDTGITELYFM
jgi:hypothetical protein